jgi:hypothetical protein
VSNKGVGEIPQPVRFVAALKQQLDTLSFMLPNIFQFHGSLITADIIFI